MKKVNFAWIYVVAVAIYLITIGSPISAKDAQDSEKTISFNESESLAALGYRARNGTLVRAARGTFVTGFPPDAYKEDDMVFLNGVIPPDPALGPIPQPEYHLMYEDPELNSPLNQSPSNLPNPENKPRYLCPHLPGAVIQMTYDPNNDGIPDPFTLKRIYVVDGRLNIGIKSNKFGIGVYNNLTGPTTVILEDGDNITRATLELPRDSAGFCVDDIVFEPFGGAPLSTSSQGRDSSKGKDRSSTASPPFTEPATLDLFNADFAPTPEIDIAPGKAPNLVNPLSKGTIRVAIITTEGFEATSVDPLSVEFGPNRAGETHQQGHIKDVDRDGDQDLLLHFRIPEIGILCSDTYLSLTGQTFDGETIIGSDFIVTRGCRDNVGIDLDH